MPENKKKNPLVGTKIKAVPKPVKEIGIDTTDNLEKKIVNASKDNNLDVSALNSFSTVSQTREQLYSLIDTMGQDSVVSAVLETYTEDVVQTNDQGKVIWCESDNEDVLQYVTFLLDSLNVDKNAYPWVFNFCKYGDLYLRLYKESDYGDDLLFGDKNADAEKLNPSKALNEDVKLKVSDKSDHYVHYVEMVKNPCEMFELTKFGKTMGFIKAPSRTLKTYTQQNSLNPYMVSYKVRQHDVNVYSATDFVHGCLESSTNRCPEEVNIYLDKENELETDKSTSYQVRRGQSILQNTFKVWREMTLLENSVLLNRLTRSSIVRILNVEVGNMGKEQVNLTLQKLKERIEQKTAINTGTGMTEYNNPGPVENMIYVPTREGKGNVTATNLGDGEVDPKKLTDLEYFRDKFFAALRIPKQIMGMAGDDNTGFNAGSSLTIISARYAKAIKRIQNAVCQTVTDLINLLLLDKGLSNYINRFTIRMQEPVTQEEIDKREAQSNKIRYVGDILSNLGEMPDDSAKLKVEKALLAPSIADQKVLQIIQEQIEKLEKQEKGTAEKKEGGENLPPLEGEEGEEAPGEEGGTFDSFNDEIFGGEGGEEAPAPEAGGGEETLPSANELGIDLTQNK